MKASELRNKTVEELRNELAELQREQLGARFLLAASQLHKTDDLRKVRRDIARVNTILTEKLSEASAK